MRTLVVVMSLVLVASACGGGLDSAELEALREEVASLEATTAAPTTTAALATTTAVPTTTAAPTTTTALATTTAAQTTTAAPTTTATPTTTTSTNCVRLTDFQDPTWIIVNDGVMGGRSQAQGVIEDGVLTWTGTIVTTGGGFSSIRGPVDGEFAGATSLTLRIRNDGRRYELLVDDAFDERARVTHYNPIETIGGVWQEISVPLTEMEARVFGNPVTAAPFVPGLATQVGVILADGLDGEFQFEIDWIDACS
ncbi:MAG: CIA30 family protein [Acidimicrobiales bacterium]|nr:CIA30 family protein [Acidimicrobiales bacterium]